MSTFILGVLIFGAAGHVIYKYWIKREPTCDCASSDCPVKEKATKTP
ncbi:FeoB-associated Cys-rich membrane protein [Vagococcus acidifermentans]|nr:FeoB-associated Cys-rich membrane protein [Vagococcus acidifermentans]